MSNQALRSRRWTMAALALAAALGLIAGLWWGRVAPVVDPSRPAEACGQPDYRTWWEPWPGFVADTD